MNNKPVPCFVIVMATCIIISCSIAYFCLLPGAVDKTFSFNDYQRNKTVTLEQMNEFVYR